MMVLSEWNKILVLHLSYLYFERDVKHEILFSYLDFNQPLWEND